MTNLGDDYSPSEARVNRIFERLSSRIGAAIMSAADDAVQAVTTQLTKAKAEIDTEVANLQASGVSAESLAGLQAISQSLDDVNPDAAPEPEPTPEPEPETPAEDTGDVVADEPTA